MPRLAGSVTFFASFAVGVGKSPLTARSVSYTHLDVYKRQVFTNAKRGQYGQLYGRIDGSIIYGWFQTYFEDRCNACENRTIRQAEAMGSDHPVTDAKAAEFIKSLINKKAEKIAK